jgi:hypothetical protein
MQKKRSIVDVFRNNSNCFKNKQAQVTVFIILGILLLLVLILVISLREEILVFSPEEVLPTEKGKIENFISNCIGEIGEDALDIVALQAGYIEIPEQIANDGSLHIQISPMHKMPYWAYGEVTAIPSLAEIKARVDKYIDENLRQCLFDLEPFQETYDLIEKSEITSNTEFVDSKVIFNVHWDVEARNKAGEVVSEVIDHVAASPIKFKKVYETAKMIIEEEMRTLKLEDLTQDLISLEHPKLPVAGLEVQCNKKRWKVDEAKQTLQDLLRVNLHNLKVEGTEIIEFPEEFPYYQNHYIWDFGEEFSKKDVTVSFVYDNSFPFIFQVTPSVGNKMTSDSLGGNELLSFLCLQNWKFTYDVVYPVVARVKDDTTGYNFNIGFMVHLIRNTPNRASEVYSRASQTLSSVTSEDYCEQANIPTTVVIWHLVDDTYWVYDKIPLEGAELTFTCLKYSCDLGSTEYNFDNTGDQAGLINNLPYCVGGILRAEKEGYKDAWTRIVTEVGEKVELELIPLYNFPTDKIKIIKHDFVDSTNIGIGKELNNDEIAHLKLTFDKNVSLLPGERHFHESSIIISESIDQEVLDGQTFQFLADADFKYNLEVNVLTENSFVGGYKANWTVSWDDLQNAEEIIFHVLSRDNANDEQTYELMMGLTTNSVYLDAPEIR